MKQLAHFLLFLSLVQSTSLAFACGTLAEPKQAELDRANLARERTIADATARRSDLVLVGKVEYLQRPDSSGADGHVTLRVSKTFKGKASRLVTLPWKDDRFIVSCNASDQFLNVGFREGWTYIVYISNGLIIRSASVNRTPYRASLTFAQERSIVRAAAKL